LFAFVDVEGASGCTLSDWPPTCNPE